ncbi:hypothetical protein IE53DRAFT_248693 [Violaceomyces palustris]|uniref:Uncharacterized protein n=1 Tax=Violaceomyces palustris TaxID=1673888 RepID=A0ACD0NNS2_9BASI|nr:hypothetical protein IE53DRAFT_248693 [Violaceomyces palustris]
MERMVHHDNQPTHPTQGTTEFFQIVLDLVEPNMLILLSYLFINTYLAKLCISISRSSSSAIVRASNVEKIESQTIHHHSHVTSNPNSPGSPAFELLSKLSHCAMKDRARLARRLIAATALFSLLSTWFYMFSYLRHSYLAYLDRCHLTSYPLPPSPPPVSLKILTDPDQLITFSHLKLVRISQWLSSLSLFEEAWMEVVKDTPGWWWSLEICAITVGSWALFLRSESKRLRIPHPSAFMALGQLVAISFSLNLFNLAAVNRLDLESVRLERAFSTMEREVLNQSSSALSGSSTTTTRSTSTINTPFPGGPVKRRLSQIRMPPPSESRSGSSSSSQSSSTRSLEQESQAGNGRRLVRRTTTKKTITTFRTPSQIPYFSPSTTTSTLWEKWLVPLLILVGMLVVAKRPDTFGKVMVMHLFPLLVVLAPNVRRKRLEETTAAAAALKKAPLGFGNLARLQLGLGLLCLLLKLRVSLELWSEVVSGSGGSPGLWQGLHQMVTRIYPITFHRHPAMSSISSDNLCCAIGLPILILCEAGSWLDLAYKARSERLGDGAPRVLEKEKEVRRREMESKLVLTLVATSPLIGVSSTLGFYLSLRQAWIDSCGCEEREEAEDSLELQNGKISVRSYVKVVDRFEGDLGGNEEEEEEEQVEEEQS